MPDSKVKGMLFYPLRCAIRRLSLLLIEKGIRNLQVEVMGV
ncbi:MAG: hypothetical protein ABSF44_09060 [Candidatus Bathyarchaeia archaeon]